MKLKNKTNKVHDDFLHKKLESGDAYPQPEIPVEDGWSSMNALLDAHPVVSLGKSVFSKSLRKTLFKGVPVFLAVTVVVTIMLIRNPNPEVFPKTVYHTENTPVTDTIASGLVASLDKHSRIEKPNSFNNEYSFTITGAVYFQKVWKAAGKYQIKAGALTVLLDSGAVYISADSITQNVLVEAQSGNVEIDVEGHRFTLKAGESFSYDNHTKKIAYPHSADPNLYSYATRIFDFKDSPLKDATVLLEKAYGMTFHFQNAGLYKCRITTRFDNKSLEEVMDIMGYTLGFQYVIDQEKRIVFISGKGCD